MTAPKKRISEMSPDEKRIAIAEACGTNNRWHLMKRGLYWRPDGKGYTHSRLEAWAISQEEAERHVYPHDEPVTMVPADNPNYLNDLNAMHEAEKCLTKDQQRKYDHFLWTRSQKGTRWDSSIHVTAQNRARAYLLTIGHEN